MSDKPLVSVVDDDLSVRDSLHSLLRSAGLQSEEFSSGKDFLESEALERTDCLVTDVDMPEMTGPELQRELTARGNEVPVIFITGNGTEALKKRVLEDGAHACLDKPFDEDALLEEIDAAVRPAV